jgi:two-component system sensor histidine kinase/response regulator
LKDLKIPRKCNTMNTHELLIPPAPKILIVDDNPQNLEVLGKLLLDCKYEIEFALNGEATLEWLNIKPFDLVLLDVNMPGMNGFEVCRAIRSIPALNKVPVIFLSAEIVRENILKGFEMGAQDYVTKPFDSRELLARVRTHLALKNSVEELDTLNKTLEEKVIERTSQLKEANDKLEVTNLKLVDLDKAKTEFLQLISHEIRTPLNGIIGPVQIIRDKSGNQGFDVLIKILDESVQRLERFSLDALLITRLKAKRHEIIKETFFLSELIGETLKEENKKLESKNLQVIFRDDSSNAYISGERELIKKCIVNILDNAIHFSPQDGSVQINTYSDEQGIICEFTDQGKGFAPDMLNHVFELFITGNDGYDNKKGIGLPVVHMIMEVHGGSITVGNITRGGAFARLLFPANYA